MRRDSKAYGAAFPQLSSGHATLLALAERAAVFGRAEKRTMIGTRGRGYDFSIAG